MSKDKRIVLTLDAGGTNFVFSAISNNEEIVEPVRLKAVTTDTEGCLATLVQGFTTVKEKLDAEPVAISFAFPGPADYAHGVIGDLPNFPSFRGGVALGPKPRSYRYTLNKKLRRLAMLSAFSQKVIDQNLLVVDNLAVDGFKTRTIVKMLEALKVSGKALIVTQEADKKVYKSAANIPGVKTAAVNTLNVYDILNYDAFIVSKGAVTKIEEVYAR